MRIVTRWPLTTSVPVSSEPSGLRAASSWTGGGALVMLAEQAVAVQLQTRARSQSNNLPQSAVTVCCVAGFTCWQLEPVPIIMS